MPVSISPASTFAAERLHTGIPLLDEEHRVLLDLYARLAACCSEYKSTCAGCAHDHRTHCGQELFAIYEELIDFMSMHFIHEESLMGGCPVDWVADHKYEHAELSTKLTHYVGGLARGGSTVTPKGLVDLLVLWMDDHVANWDVPLGRYLSGAGQAPAPVGSGT